jgi:hypothetical protein
LLPVFHGGNSSSPAADSRPAHGRGLSWWCRCI